jgi:hypothetical protein
MIYYRYVDDYLFLTKDEQSAREIHHLCDTFDARIRFELELPDENKTLSLLDFSIKIENDQPMFAFYQKPCRKPMFVHATSGIPKQQMMNFINNERGRIDSRCSRDGDKKRCLDRFQRVLVDRGHRETQRSKKLKQRGVVNEEKFFLNVPFVNDKINGMIKKALQPLGVKINLSHKSKRLKDLLNCNDKKREKCNIKNCPLNSSECHRTHVVYEMKCIKCGYNYIGSTKRKLHQRVKEHMTHKTSLVYLHNIKCKSGWNSKVIYQCHHVQQLRFMESMMIRRLAPKLNGKENVFNEHIVF